MRGRSNAAAPTMHEVVGSLGDLDRWEMDAVLAIADRLQGFTAASAIKPRAACLEIARRAMLEARKIRK